MDIPIWLPERDRPVILEYLAHDAYDNFPVIGYPNSLQKAHEHAVMTGLEMTVLADVMIDQLMQNMPPEISEKIARHVNFGRGLVKGGGRYGG